MAHSAFVLPKTVSKFHLCRPSCRTNITRLVSNNRLELPIGKSRVIWSSSCAGHGRKPNRSTTVSRWKSTVSGPGLNGSATAVNAAAPSAEREAAVVESAHQQLDFGGASVFKNKTTGELLRGLVVLKLSSYDRFVDNSLKIMEMSQRVLGQTIFNFVARSTFYGHFIAGDGEVEAKKLVEKHDKVGVATILAVTAEEDIGENEGVYDEERYDRNTNGYIECMDLSVKLTGQFRAISQLKMTSFCKADIFARMAEILAQNGFNYENDSPLNVHNLANGFDGDIPPISALNDTENKHLSLVLRRLDKICKHAAKTNTQILVDAEKTNINPGITLVTLALMLKFNQTLPVIWNTYQCYLKKTFESLKKDLRWTEKRRICFGAKIVRGAYMEPEKEYAEKFQMEDPIQPSLEATSATYNSVVGFMLEHIRKNPGRCNIIIATHNEESVLKAAANMKELQLSPTSGDVVFGQVLGLSDQITASLGQAGYLVYKSSPYGPVEDVLPYLARRAQENRSVFQNLRSERKLMLEELLRRMGLRRR